jgi:Na+-driven multidrug efflux pump
MINVAFFGLILFGLIGKFGKESLAATSAALACTNMAIMPVIGLKNALTATVGKSIGKGNKDLAVKQTYKCLKAGTIYVVFMAVCFILFRNPLMRFWSSDEKVIAVGVNIFIFSALFQVFDSIFHLYNGALRGAGDTVWPAVVSAIGAIVVLGAGGYCFTMIFPELGALGPWTGAVTNMFLVMLAMRWRFKSNNWMKIDLFKRGSVEVPAGIEAVIE